MRSIILQDKAASPNTELRLVVDEDDNGIERWREYRAPKLPPRRTQGALTVSEQDPLIDFTWSQDDWSVGALRPYYREGDRRYALAKGMDARWEGVLSLGMEQSPPLDFLIRGMGAENLGDDAKWTTGNNSLTASLTNITPSTFERQTTTANTDDGGSYAYKVIFTTATSSNCYLKQELVSTASVFRSTDETSDITIRVSAAVKLGTAESHGFKVKIAIDDGSTTDSWNSSVRTESTESASTSSWELISAERTISSDTSAINILIGDVDELSGNGNAITYYIDDINIEVTRALSDEKVHGFATKSNALYMAFGPGIYQYDDNNKVWNAVSIHKTANATDIVHFDNNIYVAYGYATAYVYGSGATWTASTIGSSGNFAKYFAVARNNAGNLGLWKSETVNTMKSSTNPVNGGSWAGTYTIGSVDRPITGLFTAFDTILVGKEDGLWQYNRLYAGTSDAENVFAPVSTEWDKGVHPDNFSKGVEWHGFFYGTASTQSFIRWSPGVIQDITSLFVAPRLPGYGGEIRALTQSPHELWLAADIPETAEAGVFDTEFGDDGLSLTSGSDNQIKIISLRQDSTGIFNVHTIDEVRFGEVNDLVVYTDANDDRFLIAGGNFTPGHLEEKVARTYTWLLPSRSAAPYIDAETTISKTGTFDTSIWHGGVPGTQKAFLKAVFWVENLGTENGSETLKVQYGLDGEDSETYTLGTLTSTDRVQTLYFNDATVSQGGADINPLEQAVGRSIQLRLTLTTTDNTKPARPKVFAFEVHSTLRPPKLKTWEIAVRVGRNILQDTGYYDPLPKTTQLARLDTLEDQPWPIYFRHTYDGHAGFDEESSTSVQIVDRDRVSMGDEYEIHRLILQETDTSA